MKNIKIYKNIFIYKYTNIYIYIYTKIKIYLKWILTIPLGGAKENVFFHISAFVLPPVNILKSFILNYSIQYNLTT